MEVGEPVPNARVVHAEHGKLLRSQRAGIALVRNRECAPLDIPEAESVVFRYRGAWAWVILMCRVADVTATRGLPPGCCTLGTGYLGRRNPAGG
jgi:hypothetical protein